jgi:glyoxylase-like metal-dependent hydrolase (beta-lactamase superfamily II)
MATLQPYEVYAVKYADHQRLAGENFIGGDPHNGPMPLDFYIWAIKGAERAWIVDTGFDAELAAQRQRRVLRSPAEPLAALGIDADSIEDVIITHMHYDHCGNHRLFDRARFHVQDKEMLYVTGRCMAEPTLRHPFDVESVVTMVRRVHGGRVVFHDGDDVLAPGISVHCVGGHTMGMQIVRVWTQRGWVVLASDASHLYANMEQQRPFPIVYNVADMLAGYRTAYALAESRRHVIPGHDPLVLRRYPAPQRALEGIVARLDVEPREIDT